VRRRSADGATTHTDVSCGCVLWVLAADGDDDDDVAVFLVDKNVSGRECDARG